MLYCRDTLRRCDIIYLKITNQAIGHESQGIGQEPTTLTTILCPLHFIARFSFIVLHSRTSWSTDPVANYVALGREGYAGDTLFEASQRCVQVPCSVFHGCISLPSPPTAIRCESYEKSAALTGSSPYLNFIKQMPIAISNVFHGGIYRDREG